MTNILNIVQIVLDVVIIDCLYRLYKENKRK